MGVPEFQSALSQRTSRDRCGFQCWHDDAHDGEGCAWRREIHDNDLMDVAGFEPGEEVVNIKLNVIVYCGGEVGETATTIGLAEEPEIPIDPDDATRV